jgi:hypothetical protein
MSRPALVCSAARMEKVLQIYHKACGATETADL